MQLTWHGCHVEGLFSCFNSSQQKHCPKTQDFGTCSKNTWSCMAAPFPCFNSSQKMTQVIPKRVICLLSNICVYIYIYIYILFRGRTVSNEATVDQRPRFIWGSKWSGCELAQAVFPVGVRCYISCFRCLARNTRCNTMSHFCADAICFLHVSGETPDVTPCHTTPPQGAGADPNHWRSVHTAQGAAEMLNLIYELFQIIWWHVWCI